MAISHRGHCARCYTDNSAFVYVAGVARPENSQMVERTLFFACNTCNSPRVVVGIFPHRWDPKNATGLLQNVPGIAIQKELPEPANNSAPPFTPDRIAGIFKQAVSSLENGNFDAAGAMTRKCLDIATKYVTNGDKRYENLWLKARIEQMTDDHLLTPELGVWAGIIREDGNSAVHDEVEFGKEEAQEMVDFTEVFLNYVFTIPGKIEDRAVTEKVKAQLSGLKAEVRALTEKIED